MIGYNGYIYVFGGEISFSNAAETPLWIYNIQVKQLTSYYGSNRELRGWDIVCTFLAK